MFDNFNPDKILFKLQEYLLLYHGNNTYEVKQIANSVLNSLLYLYSKEFNMEEIYLIKNELLHHRKWMEKCKAWNLLFGKKRREEILHIINTKWIDPDYEFCLIGDRIALVIKK